MKTSSRCHKTNVQIKFNFEKNNFAGSSIIILKKITSFLSVKNEESKMKDVSKIEKNFVRISKIKSIKKIKEISRNFRSKKCLTSLNMIFVNVVVYNFLSKQKNVKLFVISFNNIDDQVQKNTNISIDFKLIFSKEFHDLINVFIKLTFNELTLYRKHNHKIKINKKFEHNFLTKMSFRKFNFVKKYFENNLELFFYNRQLCILFFVDIFN